MNVSRKLALLMASLAVSAGAHDTSLNLSAYKGKVVLLNFWATTCGGCKVEIPWFVEFEKKYKHDGLAVIGVSLDDDGWKSVKPWLRERSKEKKLNYPIVIGNDAMAKAWDVEELPKSFLIDRKGKIVATHTGIVDKDAWERQIRALM